ncbi:hypothetical protein [Sinomonas sp. P10A9]|uniref:Uncharacterized protein n=1 Tax=Sinomonas puerhi TaxID=3238584 RepID=A0AB39KYP8_9MICC
MAHNISPKVASARAKVASLARSRREHDPELVDARRDLAAANIAAAIRKNLAAAPPLTRGQLNELHAVLNSAASQ